MDKKERAKLAQKVLIERRKKEEAEAEKARKELEENEQIEMEREKALEKEREKRRILDEKYRAEERERLHKEEILTNIHLESIYEKIVKAEKEAQIATLNLQNVLGETSAEHALWLSNTGGNPSFDLFNFHFGLLRTQVTALNHFLTEYIRDDEKEYNRILIFLLENGKL